MTEWIVSSSVLIVAILVLRKALKGRISPRLQYLLWALVLVRLLMPVSFVRSDLSVHNLGQEVLARPEIQQVYNAISDPIVPVPQQTPTPPQTGYNPVPGNTHNLPERPVQSEHSTPSQAPVVSPQTEPHTEFSLGVVLKGIWIIGMAVMAGWMVLCNLHFSRRLKCTRMAAGITGSPLPVYLTAAIETPCLFGLFRPAVYLTPDTVAEHQTLHYVLTHELTHYRQFDHVWSILRAAALMLHWYNPLVWIAFRASRQDCEMSCDAGTLAVLGEEHRGNYGRTLIGLATQTRLRSTLVTATTMADGKKAIKERIVILMKHPKTALMTLVALILCCSLIVGCTFTGAVDDPTEPEETFPVETTPLQPPSDAIPAGEMIAGTDISLSMDGDIIRLSENCLTVELEIGSRLVRRNGYIVAVLKDSPSMMDGTLYFPQSIRPHFLNRQWEVYASTEMMELSVFHGIVFFPEEILAALEDPDGSVFNQKLLAELLLPTSMGIETPHVNMNRVFQSDMLSDQSEQLIQKLIDAGFADAWKYNYGECVVLAAARTCAQAGISDNEEMTVWEFHRHQGMQGRQEFWENLTEEDRAFMNRYSLDSDDFLYLANEFSDSYTQKTEEELRAILTAYYEMDLDYLRGSLPDEVVPDTPIELTAQQIAQVNAAFASTREVQIGKLTSIESTPISCFFTSFYSDPTQIDLSDFLRHFSGEGIVENWYGNVTEEEFDHIRMLDGFRFPEKTNLDQMNNPIHKYPSAAVDAVIYHYTGYTLSEVEGAYTGADAFYSEKYDAYYNHTSDFGPGIFTCTGGLIYNDYVLLYSAQDTILTLRAQDGVYYIYSHLPVGNGYTELTAEQIQLVNQAFDFIRWEENGEYFMQTNPISSFFTSYYANPTELDLEDFLRYFSSYGIYAYEADVSEKEFYALRELVGPDTFPFSGNPSYEEAMERNAPIHKLPCDGVDAVLMHYAGISLDQMKPAEGWSVPYLEEYDCFYNFTSDFGPGVFRCTGGRIYDGYVELYSVNAMLTLVEQDGQYLIHSHLPIAK